MNKEYNKISLSPLFEIDSIIYLVNSQSASGIVEYPGRYSFWQLYYVSEGEVSVSQEGKEVRITQGNAYLFYPHGDLRCAKKAPEGTEGIFSVISFESRWEALPALSDRPIPLHSSEASLLLEICSTGRKILEPIKHDKEIQGLCEKSDTHPAVLQYLKVSLEQFFIKLYCREQHIQSMGDETEKANRHNYEKGIVRNANEYMRQNISRKLTIAEIALAIGVNETTLRITYKKETGTSIIKAFSGMKISEVHRLICETDMNFTQIGESLGFLSLYHFSRFFKENVGVTLSEYSRTIAKR